MNLKEDARKKSVRPRWRRIVPLLLCCAGTLVWLSARCQEAPGPAREQKTPLLADRFAQNLEALAKRLDVAIIAEGEPFPQPGRSHALTLNSSLSSDQAVKEVADFFDYDFVRKDNLYILTKRYTQPGDLPDVTLEECYNALKQAPLALSLSTFNSNFAGSPESAVLDVFSAAPTAGPSAEQWEKMGKDGLPLSSLSDLVRHTVWLAASRFYYQAFQDRLMGTLDELANGAPADPVFQRKLVGQTFTFGYETEETVLVPMSDAERVVAARSETPLPRPAVRRRTDATLPSYDPTAPSLLSEETKRFLNESRKSDSVITLSQAVAALNKRTPDANPYDIDANYSPKHVVMAGTDRLAPETLLQTLADIYGLQIRHVNGKSVLGAPDPFSPLTVADTKRALLTVIPPPIHRAFRLHTAPLPKQNGAPSPSPADYEKQGIAIHDKLVQMFRYLAEAQIPADSDTALPLSRLGDRAAYLFTLARMARAYTDLCAAADCPLPPYLTSPEFFSGRMTLYGHHSGGGRKARLRLIFTYTNPKTHLTYGPIVLFNNDPYAPPIDKTPAVPTQRAH